MSFTAGLSLLGIAGIAGTTPCSRVQMETSYQLNALFQDWNHHYRESHFSEAV